MVGNISEINVYPYQSLNNKYANLCMITYFRCSQNWLNFVMNTLRLNNATIFL